MRDSVVDTAENGPSKAWGSSVADDATGFAPQTPDTPRISAFRLEIRKKHATWYCLSSLGEKTPRALLKTLDEDMYYWSSLLQYWLSIVACRIRPQKSGEAIGWHPFFTSAREDRVGKRVGVAIQRGKKLEKT